MNADNKKENAETIRRISRQPVLLTALLDTGNYEFECIAYDLSLKGAKLKLDLPLEAGSEIWLGIKGNPHLPARVVWVKDQFLGLEFMMSPSQVAETLGDLGLRLPKV